MITNVFDEVYLLPAYFINEKSVHWSALIVNSNGYLELRVKCFNLQIFMVGQGRS